MMVKCYHQLNSTNSLLSEYIMKQLSITQSRNPIFESLVGCPAIKVFRGKIKRLIYFIFSSWGY